MHKHLLSRLPYDVVIYKILPYIEYTIKNEMLSIEDLYGYFSDDPYRKIISVWNTLLQCHKWI